MFVESTYQLLIDKLEKVQKRSGPQN